MKPQIAGSDATKSRLQDGHVPFGHQINRKPGQEEVGQHVDAELKDVDAQQHARREQFLDAGEGVDLHCGRAAVLAEIHQSAASPDVFKFRGVDGRMLLRGIDHPVPEQRQD
jgi:hypothetical protein